MEVRSSMRDVPCPLSPAKSAQNRNPLHSRWLRPFERGEHCSRAAEHYNIRSTNAKFRVSGNGGPTLPARAGTFGAQDRKRSRVLSSPSPTANPVGRHGTRGSGRVERTYSRTRASASRPPKKRSLTYAHPPAVGSLVTPSAIATRECRPPTCAGPAARRSWQNSQAACSATTRPGS